MLNPEESKAETSESSKPSVDDAIVDQLANMYFYASFLHSKVIDIFLRGFIKESCYRAVEATHSTVDAALEYLMMHMDDPGFCDPLPQQVVGSDDHKKKKKKVRRYPTLPIFNNSSVYLPNM